MTEIEIKKIIKIILVTILGCIAIMAVPWLFRMI